MPNMRPSHQLPVQLGWRLRDGGTFGRDYHLRGDLGLEPSAPGVSRGHKSPQGLSLQPAEHGSTEVRAMGCRVRNAFSATAPKAYFLEIVSIGALSYVMALYVGFHMTLVASNATRKEKLEKLPAALSKEDRVFIDFQINSDGN